MHPPTNSNSSDHFVMAHLARRRHHIVREPGSIPITGKAFLLLTSPTIVITYRKSSPTEKSYIGHQLDIECFALNAPFLTICGCQSAVSAYNGMYMRNGNTFVLPVWCGNSSVVRITTPTPPLDSSFEEREKMEERDEWNRKRAKKITWQWRK